MTLSLAKGIGSRKEKQERKVSRNGVRDSPSGLQGVEYYCKVV